MPEQLLIMYKKYLFKINEVNMEIKLKELNLKTTENKEYEKLIENSYSEWSNNWNNVNKKIEKNSWDGKFEIEYKNQFGEFLVDTKGDYLTFIDLEGYLGGEEFLLEEGLSLKLASHSSNILVAIVFSEAIRLGLIDEDEESYLSMLIFPEWSRGLIPNDVLEEEDIKEFFDNTFKYLEQKNILKVYPIKIEDISIEASEKEEEFLKFIKNYITKELFFYTINSK